MGLVGVERRPDLIGNPEVISGIAKVLRATEIKGRWGEYYLYGTDPGGSNVSLRMKRLTKAAQICEVQVWGRKSNTNLSACLVNPQVAFPPEGGLKIDDVKGDYFAVGPESPATIYHHPL